MLCKRCGLKTFAACTMNIAVQLQKTVTQAASMLKLVIHGTHNPLTTFKWTYKDLRGCHAHSRPRLRLVLSIHIARMIHRLGMIDRHRRRMLVVRLMSPSDVTGCRVSSYDSAMFHANICALDMPTNSCLHNHGFNSTYETRKTQMQTLAATGKGRKWLHLCTVSHVSKCRLFHSTHSHNLFTTS